MVSENVVRLHLGKVELLRPEDGSRPGDSNPADEGLSWNLEMLHRPQTNQSSCSTEACFAVNSDGLARASEMIFHNVEEIFDDVVGRVGSVDEEQIIVRDAVVGEEDLVVLLFVEPDHPVHADVLEDINVLLGMVAVSVLGVPLLDRTHECHELAWDDPVEVSVLHLLIVLVLLHVESLEVVPPEFDAILHALQAVVKRALVEAVSLGGVSVRLEETVVWLELLPHLVGSHLEDDDHECTHQERSINHLVSWVRR